MILIVDTSNQDSFVALALEEHLIDIEMISSANLLSRTLYPTIHSLLTRHHYTPQDLKTVYYGRGPGSFLGIRTAANLAAALRCSLKIHICSFISPFAYLPFEIGKFAYLMKRKGGKYPLLLGIKEAVDSKITAHHFLYSLDELMQKLEEKIDFLVIDKSLKEEITSHESFSNLPFPIVEQAIYTPFLAKLHRYSLDNHSSNKTNSNTFDLIY